MDKIVIKSRERLKRGKLMSFTDLPVEKQEIFKNIKKSINEILDTDVYVYGSHNHGYWDEESDYDVMVSTENSVNLIDKVRTEIGVKIDILFGENNLGYILIP
jgi:predicted nucleotidyltransferase